MQPDEINQIYFVQRYIGDKLKALSKQGARIDAYKWEWGPAGWQGDSFSLVVYSDGSRAVLQFTRQELTDEPGRAGEA